MFNTPKSLNGYILYSTGSKKYIGSYYKLKTLREVAKSHKVTPEEAIVLKVFNPDRYEIDRIPLCIEEFAYRHYESIIIGGILTHAESWSWDAQDFHNPEFVDCEPVEIKSNFSLQNLFKSLIHWK